MNYLGLSKNISSHEICEQSSKIVNFIDLAGHEKYLKTTIAIPFLICDLLIFLRASAAV